MDRHIRTFLFTDIENSTPRFEQHPEAMGPAQARYLRLLSQVVANHGGQVFNTEGDAVKAVFERAVDALQAAVAIQRQLRAEDWGVLQSLPSRVGLHTGEVEARDDNWFGIPLSRCARVCHAAHGDQIVLTDAVLTAMNGGLPEPLAVRDLGSHRLRGLTAPNQLYQLLHPELPQMFPPLRELEQFQTNLPRPAHGFIGRERELQAVADHLAHHRLVTLTGPGGAGKTRLAIELGHQLLDRYPDGVWLATVDLAADTEVLARVVAQALRVPERPERCLAELVVEFAGTRRLLLVLDNCETCVAHAATLVDRLLGAGPEVHVLITSQEALKLPGEVVVEVPPLAVTEPRPWDDPLDVARDSEAVQLFVQRAGNVKPGFALTADNAADVLAICRQLDGLPLAVELAAANVRLLAPAQIARRLDRPFRLLTDPGRQPAARQQTLRAMVEWSHQLLSPDEQTLFARLAVFVGGADLEAIEAICGGDGVADADALSLLSGLVNKSLVQAEPLADRPRFRLLETLRLFALERLEARGETTDLRTRHLHHYAGLAQELGQRLVTEQGQEAMLRLEQDQGNLAAAMDHATTGDLAAVGLEAALALWQFWYRRGYTQQGGEWLRHLIEAQPELPLEPRVRALIALGNLALSSGRNDVAVACGEEAQRLAAISDWQGLQASALSLLALAAKRRDDLATARHLYQAAAEVARQAQDHYRLALILINVGNVQADLGLLTPARASYEQSLALCPADADPWQAAAALSNLGNLLREEGRLLEADDVLRQALLRLWQAGDLQMVISNLINLCAVRADRRLAEDAAVIGGCVEALSRERGLPILPDHQHRLDGVLTELAREHGSDRLTRWQADGRALDVEQLMQRLRERGTSGGSS